jgi:hypothetical protein
MPVALFQQSTNENRKHDGPSDTLLHSYFDVDRCGGGVVGSYRGNRDVTIFQYLYQSARSSAPFLQHAFRDLVRPDKI